MSFLPEDDTGDSVVAHGKWEDCLSQDVHVKTGLGFSVVTAVGLLWCLCLTAVQVLLFRAVVFLAPALRSVCPSGCRRPCSAVGLSEPPTTVASPPQLHLLQLSRVSPAPPLRAVTRPGLADWLDARTLL